MPRGGHRENAGRKSGWIHRETQVIRVPSVFAEKLIEIAKKLDEGGYIDSVSELRSTSNELVTESINENELVTESIKYLLSVWRQKSDVASPKNSHWKKARELIEQLEPIVYERKILESVTKSKEHPGQMSLLEQMVSSEIDTESNEFSNENITESNTSGDFVSESEIWVYKKQCWELLGRPGLYETFRKKTPEELLRQYGVEADLTKKKGNKGQWLKLPAQNNAIPLDRVNPLPEGSERSGEG